MKKFRKTFSFRNKLRKSDPLESSKPQEWIDDETKIKDGSCHFQVKYLGAVEVFESRGTNVCEEAIQLLKKSKNKPKKSILYVSADAIRVSDEISKHLIVDQTIEKVSFCAPDRNIENGFAYICRDGTTLRWMCHAFFTSKDSGERLSHAVGCAFAICLEKKQKREQDAIQASKIDEKIPFSRLSSFRQTTLAERLLDPQSSIVVESLLLKPKSGDGPMDQLQIVPVSSNSSGSISPATATDSSGFLPRPRASPSILERQYSLRIFPRLQETSPFKQGISCRLRELPSSLDRYKRTINNQTIQEEITSDIDQCIAFPPVSSSSQTGQSCSGSMPKPHTDPPNPFDAPGTNCSSLDSKRNSSLMATSETAKFCSNFTWPNANFTSAQTAVSKGNHFADLSLELPLPTNGEHSLEVTSSNSAPDPFSDAPINQETIHQHYRQQQQQVQPALNTDPVSSFVWPVPIWQRLPVSYPVSTQTTSTISYGTALFCTSEFDSPHPSTQPTPKNLHILSKPAQLTLNGSADNYVWTQTRSWRPPAASLLPPERGRFSDPFDLAWVDQNTAVVKGQLYCPLRVVSTLSQSSSNPLPTASCGNPFLPCFTSYQGN